MGLEKHPSDSTKMSAMRVGDDVPMTSDSKKGVKSSVRGPQLLREMS